MKATEWAEKIGELVKGYVDRVAQAIDGRIKALEDRAPEKGEPGKSVTIDDVRPLIEDAIASIERPKDGTSITVDMVMPALLEEAKKAIAALPVPKSVTVEEMRPLVEEAISAIPKPKDGASVTVEMVLPTLIEEAKKAVAALPVPKDGKSVSAEELSALVDSCVEPKVEAAVVKAIEAIARPKDGSSVTIEMVLPDLLKEAREAIAAIPLPKDGKSITVEDIVPILRSMQAEWALEFERRAHDAFQRAIDRMPEAKNGADGLGFEDVEQIDDGATYGVRFKRGDRVVEFKWTKPTLADAYRGIFKEGTGYVRGETATFGGSLFMATRDTGAKPETDDSWRLIVKRGRDGKDWTPAK